MSDQTTISSADDSISAANATTTTTPPIGEFHSLKTDTNNNVTSNSLLLSENSSSKTDFKDLSGVLGSLNLDDPDLSSSLFSAQLSPVSCNKVPSTPPHNSVLGSHNGDWNNTFSTGWNYNNKVNHSFSTIPEVSTTAHNHSNSASTASTNSQGEYQQNFVNFDSNGSGSGPGNSGASGKFVSLTPDPTHTYSNLADNTFNRTNQSTPFSSTKVAVPSSAPPGRRTSNMNFVNSGSPFVLPETKGDESSFQASSKSSKNSPAASLLSPNRETNPNAFGPPLLAETSRRLTYPLSSPNQQSIVELQDCQLASALHPVLKNDILNNNVAGSSVGMGITNNDGRGINSSNLQNAQPSQQLSQQPPQQQHHHQKQQQHPHQTHQPLGYPTSSQYGFLPDSNSYNGFQISQPSSLANITPPNLSNQNLNLNSPANTVNLGVGSGMNSQSFTHLASAGGFPPVLTPNGFSQNYNYISRNYNNSFSSGIELNKLSQTQELQSQNPQLQQLNQGQAPNNLMNQRSNLGLNATANIHRKHSSNNRRGEDASKFINANLNDFINEIYFLCKDQHGCRFLQKQLEVGGVDAATKIFNEIQLNVIELMIDPFGNYLIQKLLERVNPSQRTTLVKNASSQFVRIALDPHGTRALQKLVECIDTEAEFQIIIHSLSSYIVLLSRDLNGNHVVQKCLQKLPPDSCNFIFDAACENCVKIAKHRHGCCVLQRCFDHGTPKQCERLSLKVGENCVDLSVDPYGNYVVQYVLSMEENRLRIQNDPVAANKIPNTANSINLIIRALGGHLTKLSTHKFGSNVIEKSLRIPTLAPVLIQELLKDPEGLKLLLHDAYGNYVLQTSLDVADDSSFKELGEMLKPYLNDVRNTPHGRRILSKLISRGGAPSNFNVGNLPPMTNTASSGHDHQYIHTQAHNENQQIDQQQQHQQQQHTNYAQNHQQQNMMPSGAQSAMNNGYFNKNVGSTGHDNSAETTKNFNIPPVPVNVNAMGRRPVNQINRYGF